MDYNFEWDPTKARSNRDKHAVAFEEAATVFRDSRAATMYDPDHSRTEDRWITLGISNVGRLLVVYHTFHDESGEAAAIRICSAGRRPGTRPRTTKGTNHETRVRFFEGRKGQGFQARREIEPSRLS